MRGVRGVWSEGLAIRADVAHRVPAVTHCVPAVAHRVPGVAHHVPAVAHRVPDVTVHVPAVTHRMPDVRCSGVRQCLLTDWLHHQLRCWYCPRHHMRQPCVCLGLLRDSHRHYHVHCWDVQRVTLWLPW